MSDTQIEKEAREIAFRKGMERRYYFYPQLGFRDDRWETKDGHFWTDKEVVFNDFVEKMAR